MGSTVIAIPDGEEAVLKERKENKFQCHSLFLYFLKQKKPNHDMRKLIHSIKVGVALVLVSLLYLLNPLYEQVGDNAMWAIMTVVVIFEFFAGATLSKGLNRGLGTVLGGALGCLAAAFAQEVGGTGNAVVVGIFVFMFGAAATYSRLVPSIKRKYDYGSLIFILTFNLVAVSGLRAGEVLQLARQRLSTIVMGFAVCIFTSLLVFPIWASDELHDSVASRFEVLAHSIEGCLEEYFKTICSEKQNHQSSPSFSFSGCKSVLHSNSKEEQLANFARWEPWHGRFGFSYPWNKYLHIAAVLRELAVVILAFKGCLQSPGQSSGIQRQPIREPCESVGKSLAWILRELGESISTMKRCQTGDLIESKLKSMRVELSNVTLPSTLGQLENHEGLAMASFVFSLMEMVDQVEGLAKEVQEFGALVNFQAK